MPGLHMLKNYFAQAAPVAQGLVSKCCQTAIFLERKGEEITGNCSKCGMQVVKEDPESRQLLWMNGNRFGK